MTKVPRDLAAELHRLTALEFCADRLHEIVAGVLSDFISRLTDARLVAMHDALGELREWALERGLDLSNPAPDWERHLTPRRPSSPPGMPSDPTA